MSTAKTATSAKTRKLNTQKTFCEFFAGIGLVREGLEHSGWKCTYANDIDEKKESMYAARFGNAEHFHLGDVWETQTVLDRMGSAPFLATASFPCVDLSLAGHFRGFTGEHSSTFFGFVEVLRALGDERPSMVMLENVAGFLRSHGGADFESAVRHLAELGYWIDTFVVDAKYFVPQSRPRVFVVAVHDRIKPAIAMSSNRQKNLFENEQTSVSIGPTRPSRLVELMNRIDLPTGWLQLPMSVPPQSRANLAAFVDLDDEQEWWDEAAVKKHHDMMSDLHRAEVDGFLEGGGVHIGTIYRRKRYGKTRAETRFDGVAGCLRTPRGGSARQIVIAVENGRLRMRWMSPREYSRLQGAGDFPLTGKTNQMLFGFGDAVCVPVIRWMDEQILTPIFDSASLKRGRKHG